MVCNVLFVDLLQKKTSEKEMSDQSIMSMENDVRLLQVTMMTKDQTIQQLSSIIN